MSLLLANPQSTTVFYLVLYAIIVLGVIILLILYAFWRKEKLKVKGNFMFKMDAWLQRVCPLIKRKYIINTNHAESAFYWSTLLLGIAKAVMLFVSGIMYNTLGFECMSTLIFVVLLLFMTAIDYKMSAMYPYYYEYNPSLFIFAIFTILIGFIDLVVAMATGYWLTFLLGFTSFAGIVLMYGLIVLQRFFKAEFKPLELLIYLGAVIITAIDVTSFALNFSLADAFAFAFSVVSLVFSILVTILVLYLFDKFGWIKKLLKK